MMESKAVYYYRSLVSALSQTNIKANYYLSVNENMLREQLYPGVKRVITSHFGGQDISSEKLNEIIEYHLSENVKSTILARKSGRPQTLINLESTVIKTLNKRGIDINKIPYLAVFPTGKFSARILKVPNSDEHLVLFDNQIFTFALLIAKIFALSIPCSINNEKGSLNYTLDFKAIGNHVYDNPDPIKRLYELVFAHLFQGGINNAPSYSVSKAEYKIAEIIFHSIELFILSHEYAHWLNGDLTSEKSGAKSISDLEEIGLWFGWDREFQADKLGIELVINSISDEYFDKSWVFASVMVFFEILHIFDKASSIFSKADYDNKDKRMILNNVSHPPPRMRIGSFRTNFDKLEVDNEISITLLSVLETLWEEVESMIINYKNQINKKNT